MITTQPVRWRRLVAATIVSLACAVSAGAASQRHDGKLSAKVQEEAKAKRNARLDVLVRFRKAPGDAERSLVNTLGGEVRQFGCSPWTAAQLPGASLEALANSDAVEFVTIDGPVAGAMDVARLAAGQPPLTAHESSLTGTGVTIAMLDTGVARHPEIKTLVAAADFVADKSSTTCQPARGFEASERKFDRETSVDQNGHGTHVAGIMVGDGSHSYEGRYAGVAPGASLVSVRVLDRLGRGMTSDALAGLHWIADHKNEHGIRVVNLSLGHPVYEPAEVDPLVQAVDALWDAGIVVVCSAGNAGDTGAGAIRSPCNSRKVITVGALNDWNTPDTVDDTVTTYSSRGPTRFDLVAKPDILAPGNRIVSTRVRGSYLDATFPDRRVAGDPNRPHAMEHFEMSGTSMAAPLVSGTAALMLEQDPSLNPGTVKARLMLSARKPTVGNPFATGAGALDILAALRASGRVADAPSPLIFPDRATGRVAFENTAVLWSEPLFSLAALFPNAVLWSDDTQWDSPLVWSYAVLWPDETASADALLWPDASLWPDATLWPDSILWSDAVLWTDATLWADATLWDESFVWSEAVLWPDEAPLASEGTTRSRPAKKN